MSHQNRCIVVVELLQLLETNVECCLVVPCATSSLPHP